MGSSPNDPYAWQRQDLYAHPADQQRRPETGWHVPDPSPPFQPTPFQPAPSSTIPVPVGPGMPARDVLPFIGRSAGGDFLLNLIFVGVLWEVWICLYPLSAIAGLLTLLYGMPFLRGVVPASSIIAPGLYAVGLAFIAAAVVLWNVSRLEHVLARTGLYRVLRHLVRLPLVGLATVVALESAQGLPYDPTMQGVRRVLNTPANLVIVVGVMIASHFILWNWKWARGFWHHRLVAAQLRKRAA
jgi:hypothetical protein